MTDDLQGKKEEQKEGQTDPKPGDGDAGADPKNTGDSQVPGPIPYDRFKEVNDRARAYEKRLAELEAKNLEREKEQEQKRVNALKEQENFKELAMEWEGKVLDLTPKYEAVQGQLEEANKLLAQYADAQIELVPELFRDVVSKMPLTERLAWLTDNKDKLGKGKPGGIPATPTGKGNAEELTQAQRRQRAARTF